MRYDLEDLYRNIREIRRKHKTSMKEIEDKYGHSTTSICNYENKRSVPGTIYLIDFCQEFGVTFEDLFKPKELKMIIDDDGVARVYNDEYDITIHCESKEERDAVIKILKKVR